jgi:hypothetical protein
VTISWEIDAPANANFAGCEQEIYISTDKGRTVAARLTPEFSYGVTSYTLTVPNLPTKKAVIIMGFGCEGATPIFESQYPQKQSVFRISQPPAELQEVRLTSARHTANGSGEEINLRWDSSVRNVDHFEIQMSSDRGAHFETIGLASAQASEWHLPEGASVKMLDGFSGEIVFKVVAHKSDATSIESLMAN